MTLTLLLDLDDTLLENSMDVFVPAYLKSLGGAMAQYAEPDHLVAVLLRATQSMLGNTDFRSTLKEAFDQDFYPVLGLELAQVQPIIDAFYREQFPRLSSITRQRPAAIQLIQEAQRRGCRIAIATNPLFPATAIHQRLAWAGLPAEEFQFDLVSTYEEFHFAKPNPAYFAEVLARLGWPEGPVVLVGDDPLNDVSPANQLGLAVYHIANPPAPAANGGGSLNGVLPWIDEQTPESLVPRLDSPAAIFATLASTPAALGHRLNTESRESLRVRPKTDEWSFTEVLCHLRDVDAEVTLPRLDAILASPDAFIQAVDPDAWAETRGYQKEDPQAVFAAWSEQRAQLLAHLHALAPADWDRKARHTIFGPTTLLELMQITARHDRIHVRQAQDALTMANT